MRPCFPKASASFRAATCRSPIRVTPTAASFRSAFAPTPQIRDTGSGSRNSRTSPGRTTTNPFGFPEVARDLRDELRGRHPDRRGQSQFLADRLPDRAAHRLAVAEQPFAARHVKKRLVEAQRLDQRRVAMKDRPNLSRDV